MDADIREFARGDEAAFEEWVRQHGGYVLVQRDEGFMLHEASCGHLDLIPDKFALTRRPRRCAETQEELVRWTQEATGAQPLRCQNCM